MHMEQAMAIFCMSGRRPCGQLATTSVATISIIIFMFIFSRFFSSIVYFSHRRSARIKKLIYWKLTGAPKNLGVFFVLAQCPDVLSHFHASAMEHLGKGMLVDTTFKRFDFCEFVLLCLPVCLVTLSPLLFVFVCLSQWKLNLLAYLCLV